MDFYQEDDPYQSTFGICTFLLDLRPATVVGNKLKHIFLKWMFPKIVVYTNQIIPF